MSPEAIDALLAAGCTVEQLAAAVKADMRAEEARALAKKEARRAGNRKRQQAWRDRRNANNESNGVTTRYSPPPKEKSPPEPPSKEITPDPTSSEPNGSTDVTRARRGTKTGPIDELMKVLDEQRAADVVAHRHRVGKPLTASAAAKLADKLAQWPNPNEAADEMLANGWQGFEPAWLEGRRAFQTTSHGRPVGSGRARSPSTGPPAAGRPETDEELLARRKRERDEREARANGGAAT